MTILSLYRYTDGKQIIDTLEKPDSIYEERFRLIADFDKLLTCGNGIFVETIDIDKRACKFWREVDKQND